MLRISCRVTRMVAGIRKWGSGSVAVLTIIKQHFGIVTCATSREPSRHASPPPGAHFRSSSSRGPGAPARPPSSAGSFPRPTASCSRIPTSSGGCARIPTDSSTSDVDFLFPWTSRLWMVEVKAARTVQSGDAASLHALAARRPAVRTERFIVHRAARQAMSTRVVAPGVRAASIEEFVALLSADGDGTLMPAG